MASIGISESTFAIALLAEQQSRQWGNMASYPVLPSLFDEAGVGWDAYLPIVGAPMFLQFKISDYMAHWRSAHHAYLQNTPYYRFHLHPSNNFQQHARLRALSQVYPDTYYVAPEINTGVAFQNAYLSQTVTLSRLRDFSAWAAMTRQSACIARACLHCNLYPSFIEVGGIGDRLLSLEYCEAFGEGRVDEFIGVSPSGETLGCHGQLGAHDHSAGHLHRITRMNDLP
jgi:hypothetical protein